MQVLMPGKWEGRPLSFCICQLKICFVLQLKHEYFKVTANAYDSWPAVPGMSFTGNRPHAGRDCLRCQEVNYTFSQTLRTRVSFLFIPLTCIKWSKICCSSNSFKQVPFPFLFVFMSQYLYNQIFKNCNSITCSLHAFILFPGVHSVNATPEPRTLFPAMALLGTRLCRLSFSLYSLYIKENKYSGGLMELSGTCCRRVLKYSLIKELSNLSKWQNIWVVEHS